MNIARPADGNIFQLLRDGTSEIHRRTEERVPVSRRDFGREDYARLIEHFYGFWAPVETELSRLDVLRKKELGLERRLKAHLLEKDLCFLGRDPTRVARCRKLPVVDTFQRGVGCLYVMEGSTLGARIISRQLEERFQMADGSGASFFNAYGPSTGRNWKAFQSFVTARVKPEDATEIVAAAQQTFQYFYEWLGSACEDTVTAG